ncbi:hypothetical protein GGX14DRAFT_660956 [Mycena pura]|uniref:Uncharacterized protein n=1 Tax=Mycena pura TaxID=153505 RepID=A0AAD6Y593_9AGAR|nr:hypothetical protein GGX14DRAFT_660956 [Mycena pura]
MCRPGRRIAPPPRAPRSQPAPSRLLSLWPVHRITDLAAGADHATSQTPYAGTNPCADLATMVAAHRRHCVGRDLSGSQSRRCVLGKWQPPTYLAQQFKTSESAPHGQAAGVGGSHHGDRRTDGHWRPPQTDEDGDDAWDDVAPDGTTYRFAEGSIARAERPPEPGHPSTRHPDAAPAAAYGDTNAYRWEKAKKTARKESERKALLEADPWAHAVSATEVVCGGCGQTIKLDARSRYYPGLWQKHRDRCDAVRLRRAALEERMQIQNVPGTSSGVSLHYEARAEQKQQETTRLEARGAPSRDMYRSATRERERGSGQGEPPWYPRV